MGRYVWQVFLLAHILTVPSLCQDDTLSVVVDINKDSISLEVGDPDLCKGFPCPIGTKCVIQKSPALLMIPIPHCVADKPSPAAVSNGMCKKVSVGTNILQCKTESEWLDIGKTQCRLSPMQDQPTRLVNSRTWHVCPPFGFSRVTKYLSASFNCCREGYGTTDLRDATPTTATTRVTAATASSREVHEAFTTSPPAPVHHAKGIMMVKEKLDEIGQEAAELTGLSPTDSTVESTNIFYLLLLVLGLSFLLSFLLISLLVSLRLKQRRRLHESQRKVAVTSMVNPAASAEYDNANIIHHSSDKSNLVDKMQITY